MNRQETIKSLLFLDSAHVKNARWSIANWSCSRISYEHHDHLGSTVAISDMDGQIVWQGAYTPQGEQVSLSGKAPRAAFTGKQQDATGLYYYGARYYDPSVMRFTQPDPLVLEQTRTSDMNPYPYVRNNPLSLVDPDGKNPVWLPVTWPIIWTQGDTLFNSQVRPVFERFWNTQPQDSVITGYDNPIGTPIKNFVKKVLMPGWEHGNKVERLLYELFDLIPVFSGPKVDKVPKLFEIGQDIAKTKKSLWGSRECR